MTKNKWINGKNLNMIHVNWNAWKKTVNETILKIIELSENSVYNIIIQQLKYKTDFNLQLNCNH